MSREGHLTQAKDFSSLDLDVTCISSLAMVLAATKVSRFKRVEGQN